MSQSCSEKLIHIIVSSILEERIEEILERSGVDGFTSFDVRGSGSSGLQSGHLEGESNVMFMVVVPDRIYPVLVDNLNQLMRRGHHMMVFSSDVAVITPSKCHHDASS